MAGFSIFKSTPPTITPPTIKLDNAAPSERLEQVQSLLRKGGEKSSLFATKINGETILYVARDAKDGRQLPHDQGFRNVAARAELARKELGNILRACVKEKVVDGTAPGAYGKLNDHKAEMRGLLNNAIDNTTRTTEVPITDGFAPPGQGQGRTGSFFSLPSLTWMRSFGRSAPPPEDPDILDSLTAYQLNNVVADFARRFERFDAAERAAERKVPDFPATDNTDTMLTKTLEGIDESFPILEVGGKMFEPIERLGAGSYGQVLRYRSEDGETKVVKLARQRPDDPAKTPEQNKAVRDYYHEKHRKESAFELNAGQKYAAGKPNVLGFTEHVMLSNDTVALIGDDAGGGDIAHFAPKLHAQVYSGRLGMHELRLVALTLTRDVTQGVASLKAAGAVHGDMKPGNQVIDANGMGHLIDLGFTEGGPITMRGHLLSNSSYNAPEAERLVAHKRAGGSKDSPIDDTDLVPPAKRLHQALAELVSPEKQERAAGYTGAVTWRNEVHAAELLGEGVYGIDSRADVFGAGITMTALMTGRFPSDIRAQQHLWETAKIADFASPDQQQEMLAEAAKTKVAAASNLTMKGVSFVGGSANGYIKPVGDATTDALLNDMLTPNRENRMEAEQVLEHPTMSYAAHNGVRAVGSPEVRNLIKAIAGGNEMEIAMATEVLRAVHPDPFPAPPVFGGMVPPPPPGLGPDAAARPAPAAPAAEPVVPASSTLEPLFESIPTGPNLPSAGVILENLKQQETVILSELDLTTPPTPPRPPLSSDGWSPPPPPPPLSSSEWSPPPPPPLSSSEWSPPPPPPLSSGEWSPSNATPLRSSQIPPAPPLSGDPGYLETGSDASTPPPLPPRPPADLDPDGKVRFDP